LGNEGSKGTHDIVFWRALPHWVWRCRDDQPIDLVLRQEETAKLVKVGAGRVASLPGNIEMEEGIEPLHLVVNMGSTATIALHSVYLLLS
jgi:hypothetical protein